MTKSEMIENYWGEFIIESHDLAINQVGHGKFPNPHNDLFYKPTEEEFWLWFTRTKLQDFLKLGDKLGGD